MFKFVCEFNLIDEEIVKKIKREHGLGGYFSCVTLCGKNQTYFYEICNH